MPKVVELEESWGIYARTSVTSSTIDEISGRTEETSEKTAGTCVKISESCDTTDSPAPVRENWLRIGVTFAKIDATCGGIIEICDTIVRTVAMTAETCGTIWEVKDTEAVSHSLNTTEPVEASASAGSSV